MKIKIKNPLKVINALPPKRRIILYTILDIFCTWGIPVILIAIKYDLFLEIHVAGKVQATGILYIFLLILVGAIIWRCKAILTYTRSLGLRHALTKSLLPFVFLLFYIFLGRADTHIDRLRFILLGSAIGHFIAIYFRYHVGKAAKEIADKSK